MRNIIVASLLKFAVMLACAPPQFTIEWICAKKPATVVPTPESVPAPTPNPTPKTGKAPSKASVQVRRLMFFTATWCGHCKPTERACQEWKKTAKPRKGEHVEFEKVDGDLYPARVQQWNVTAYPTLIVTLNGREIARHEGGGIRTAAGVERFVSQEREPTRRVSIKNVLKPEFRDTERMRRHLVEDHGYTAEEVRGKSREWLFQAHDEAHGEVLR